jgi:VWFA-related protein
MPRRVLVQRLVAAAVSALALFAGGRAVLGADPLGPAAQDARSRERAIYVSVVNRDGVPATDLTARDFVVREDGVAREVLSVREAAEPVTLALVVDNSQAAASVIPDVRTALRAFVERMGGHNPMAVTTIADRPTILQDYTLVVPQLVRAVGRIFPVPGSGAFLLDALSEVANGFSKRDFERGVIVVITTEGTEFSDPNEQQVLPKLRQSGAALHAFVLTSQAGPDMRSSEARSRAIVLDAGPRETGGRRVDLLSSMSMDAALQKLANQLSHEYLVTYSRPESLIPPEKISVAVTRPELEALGTPVRPKRP